MLSQKHVCARFFMLFFQYGAFISSQNEAHLRLIVSFSALTIRPRRLFANFPMALDSIRFFYFLVFFFLSLQVTIDPVDTILVAEQLAQALMLEETPEQAKAPFQPPELTEATLAGLAFQRGKQRPLEEPTRLRHPLYLRLCQLPERIQMNRRKPSLSCKYVYTYVALNHLFLIVFVYLITQN